MLTNRRTIEVFKNNSWVLVEGLTSVKKGQKFRAFELEDRNTAVTDNYGNTEFIAQSDGFDDNGIGTIIIEDEEK